LLQANQRSALIFKCFTSRDPFLLLRAFNAYVRPLLEYASCVWSPFKLHFIDKIESVQRRFTKRFYGLSNLSYEDRLYYLCNDSLEERRIKADLAMYYKILHNLVDVDCNQFFCLINTSVTRGHSLRMIKPFCNTNFQLNNFKCRAINAWNHLDSNVVLSNNINQFKTKLNNIDLSNCCKRSLV